MICKTCGSKMHVNARPGPNKIQYKCTNPDCPNRFLTVTNTEDPAPGNDAGIPISKFLGENDVSTKVQEALNDLDPNRLYSVDDIIEKTGLRKGFPLLRSTLDAHREYYGKGVVDGKIYYGHPEKIAELKRLKTMS